MVSKFLKFQPVLSCSEAIQVLGEVTGVSPPAQAMEVFTEHGYLTPIYGYEKFLLGFNLRPAMNAWKCGEAIEPCAFSNVGVVGDAGAGVSQIIGPVATTTDGQDLLFLAVPEGADIFGGPYAIHDLESVGSLPGDAHYLTQEVFAVAELAASANIPCQPEAKGDPRINLVKGWELGFDDWLGVSELHGFNTPSGKFLAPHHVQKRRVQASVSQEERPSLTLAIAALLELLREPVQYPRPQGMNQAAISAIILERFRWRGLGSRNLQKIFSAANEAMAKVE